MDVRVVDRGRRAPDPAVVAFMCCPRPSGMEMAAVDEHARRHATRHPGRQVWTPLTQASQAASRR